MGGSGAAAGGLRARARSEVIRRAPWPPSGLVWALRTYVGGAGGQLGRASRLSSRRLMLVALVAATTPFAGPPDLRSGLIAGLTRRRRPKDVTLEHDTALREQIARKLLSRPRSATRSAKTYGLSVCGRPADQARVARSRTALRLPGGDIFLDLLSPDIGKSVPVRSEGQITSVGIGGRRGQTR